MICDKVYRLRVKKGVILPEYLAIILNAPNVLIEVEKLKSGINDSGVNLTQNKFIQLQIPYPLIEDQKSLTQIVTDKVDSISRLDEDIEKQMLKAEKNKQSILASAFSGELGSA
jgi:type I restriction enzyme, S subunit